MKCILNDIKAENIVIGFWGSGISPVNKEEVIKRIGSNNEQLNEIVKQQLVSKIVRVLQENVDIGKEPQTKLNKKRGKKITPGQPITSSKPSKPPL